jgi:putative colanic acid biosynthesis UDP-glucose lipid carrier transferase
MFSIIWEIPILIQMNISTVVEPKKSYSGSRRLDDEQKKIREFFNIKYPYFVYKRAMDIFTSLVVIVLIFPWLFPLLFVLVKLDSRGPAFFKQKRVGFLGKVFWCYKFRTMYVNDVADTRQAIRNDPRVTRLGRFLRSTCIDELPQFINVLLGHMSIVGPRPHMLKDSQEFSAQVSNYKFRYLSRPGITGLSQIRGYRGPATTFQSIFHRYQWDAYYIRNMSFSLDLRIMSETAILMFKSVFLRNSPVPVGNTGLYDRKALGPAKKIA